MTASRAGTGSNNHSPSSKRWLRRQATDPYVKEARRLGYRSRAAFKLKELDDRFRLLAPGRRIVDLGSAPGGWTRVAVERVRPRDGAGGRVIAVDRAPMTPVAGADCIQADIDDVGLATQLLDVLGGRADVVLSDMAPAATGHPGTDHVRIMALAEAALDLAKAILAEGGAFVCKLWQGGGDPGLANSLKRDFARVRRAKPPASRSESAEIYLVATGFRGVAD
jgi:23S rRNA (uridine2552-2'-O)-methyltransferase